MKTKHCPCCRLDLSDEDWGFAMDEYRNTEKRGRQVMLRSIKEWAAKTGSTETKLVSTILEMEEKALR